MIEGQFFVNYELVLQSTLQLIIVKLVQMTSADQVSRHVQLAEVCEPTHPEREECDPQEQFKRKQKRQNAQKDIVGVRELGMLAAKEGSKSTVRTFAVWSDSIISCACSGVFIPGWKYS